MRSRACSTRAYEPRHPPVGEPRTIADVATQLREWGLPEDDISELEAALTADSETGGELIIGHQTESWLGRIATRLGTGAGQVVEGVTVETIVALLTKLVAA